MTYYANIDHEKKTIIIDMSKPKKPADQELIDFYAKQGYKMRIKSERRAIAMRERQKEKASVKEIEEILKPFEDLKKTFKDIKEGKGTGKGAFAAKSWYENTAKAEIEKRNKDKQEESK